MDRQRYNEVIETFFTCAPEEITAIFREFLDAMAAQEALPPAHMMSQNYATARANPEPRLARERRHRVRT